MGIIEENFEGLCKEVISCVKCPRMSNSARILSRSAGPLNAPIMFIGEAPGRLGADNSGIPFHGDKAGHNFEDLLEFVGINRGEIFITNSVLCNPKDLKGNNAPPNKHEIQNCSFYLKKQIELINPRIVVTLGATALNATSLLTPHKFSLKTHVRTINAWYGRKLIPLYHPGQRAMIHRNLINQRSDYQFVKEQFIRLGKPKRRTKGKTKESVTKIVNLILSKCTNISYFALHKLFYLVEYKFTEKTGSRLTDAYFIRQKDGPYCTDLHITKLKNGISDLRTSNTNGILNLTKSNGNLFVKPEVIKSFFTIEEEKIIDEVLEKHGRKTNEELKTTVYLTKPIKNILRTEKNKKINLYNSQIEF
jgi:uracil-DNA glycosylase family 4